MKMMNPELNVVRFNSEDVIATSGTAKGTYLMYRYGSSADFNLSINIADVSHVDASDFGQVAPLVYAFPNFRYDLSASDGVDDGEKLFYKSITGTSLGIVDATIDGAATLESKIIITGTSTNNLFKWDGQVWRAVQY